jgi:hypothetical protein
MAGAIAQSKDLGSAASAASIALAFPGNNTAGNVLFVAANAGNSGVTLGVSDSQGNTYVPLDTVNDTVDSNSEATWCVTSCNAGANTVTVSVSPSTAFPGIYIAELSGLQNAAADAHKGQQQTTPGTATDAVTSGTVTTTTTDFAIAYSKQSNGAGALSPGTGFTNDANMGGFAGWGVGVKAFVETKAGISSGTVAGTFTSSSATASLCTLAAWFKEAGGASPPILMGQACL